MCFESKTSMYQNATYYLGSDENISIENLLDKILEFLFISYVTCKLRVLRETGPRTGRLYPILVTGPRRCQKCMSP